MSLINDPRKWSGSMVSSWTRFWYFAIVLIAAIGYTVSEAALYGWRSALGGAIFLAAFQIMMLYALRRMYLQASGQDAAPTAKQVRTWRLMWALGLSVAVLAVATVYYFRFHAA